MTENVWVDVPDRVAEVLSDLKKGADNAMPDPYVCSAGCGATTTDPTADDWLPCSGCGGAFCPKCAEVHRGSACFAEGQ